MPHVTCENAQSWHESTYHYDDASYHMQVDKKYNVAVIDYGVKRNILRLLTSFGCHVKVFPATSSFKEIMAFKPDGVLLSNGPGDPIATGQYAIPLVQEVLKSKYCCFWDMPWSPNSCLSLGSKNKKNGHWT